MRALYNKIPSERNHLRSDGGVELENSADPNQGPSLGLAPLFDKKRLGMYDIVIFGVALPPDLAPRLPITQPGPGISQPFGCVVPKLVGLGTQVDRPQ
jgi:hypothetical protein